MRFYLFVFALGIGVVASAQTPENEKAYLGYKYYYYKTFQEATNKVLTNRIEGINLHMVVYKNYFIEMNHSQISNQSNEGELLKLKFPNGGYYQHIQVGKSNYFFNSSIGRKFKITKLSGLNVYASFGASTQFEKRTIFGYYPDPDAPPSMDLRYSGERTEWIYGAQASINPSYKVPILGHHMVFGLYFDQYFYKEFYPRAFGFTAGLQIYSFKIRKDKT